MDDLNDRIEQINFSDTGSIRESIDNVFNNIKKSSSDSSVDNQLKKLFEDIKNAIVFGLGTNIISANELFYVVTIFKRLIKERWNNINGVDFDENYFTDFDFDEKSIRSIVKEKYFEEYSFYHIVYDDLKKEASNTPVIEHLKKEIFEIKKRSYYDPEKLKCLERDLRLAEFGPNFERALESWGMLEKNDGRKKVLHDKEGSHSGSSRSSKGKSKKNKLWEQALINVSNFFTDVKSKFNNKKSNNQEKEKKEYRSNKSKSCVNHGQNKKVFYKGLLVVGGFISGIVLSSISVPSAVRVIGMAASGVKIISNKFPESQVTKAINTSSRWLNDKVDKFPKIKSGITKCRNFFKKDSVKTFINSATWGYLSGSVVEFVTGLTPGQHLERLFSNQVNTNIAGGTTNLGNAGNNKYTSVTDSTMGTTVTEPVVTDPVVDAATAPTDSGMFEDINLGDNADSTINTDNSIGKKGKNLFQSLVDVDLFVGDIHDISGLANGYTSSDGLNLVHLNTSKGTAVVVDKFGVSLSGEPMVHFKQLNGEGYAWFKVFDVKSYLSKIYKLVSKVFGR